MQNDILYFRSNRAGKSPIGIAGNACYQVLVFSIAQPLACCVVLTRGILMLLRLMATISFTCCVWIFLVSMVLLFIMVLSVHLAVASVG